MAVHRAASRCAGILQDTANGARASAGGMRRVGQCGRRSPVIEFIEVLSARPLSACTCVTHPVDNPALHDALAQGVHVYLVSGGFRCAVKLVRQARPIRKIRVRRVRVAVRGFGLDSSLIIFYRVIRPKTNGSSHMS